VPETRAKSRQIANVKNAQFLAREGRVSRNFVQFIAFASGFFPARSLAARLVLTSAPLSVSLIPGGYHGVQDPGVLGAVRKTSGTASGETKMHTL
jgi:hypothetical protein